LALTPGTRLGPYEVTAQIGVGGMGEVYRATDTNPGRQVAIKVLPDLFATDPDRVARFQREAQVLASLNHPFIAAIHGFEDDVRSAQESALRAPILQGVSLQGGRRGGEDFQSDRRTELAGRASLTVEGTAG
jgi:serine/threonine protein kinase